MKTKQTFRRQPGIYVCVDHAELSGVKADLTYFTQNVTSMQDSAREARLSLGRPSSHATRQQALEQVAMLKAAKDRASREQK